MIRRFFGLSAGVFAVLVLIGAFTKPVQAATITVQYTGVVDDVDASLAGTFSVGQILTGTYTFDSTVAARAGGTSVAAVFDALLSMNFSIGAYSASLTSVTPVSEIQVDNDGPPNDIYAVVAKAADGLSGPSVGSKSLGTTILRLDDSTNTAIVDALVLPTNPKLGAGAGQFSVGSFFDVFVELDQPDAFMSGHLTSLEVSDVPIPAALALFPAGLGVIGLLARRRKKRVAQSSLQI